MPFIDTIDGLRIRSQERWRRPGLIARRRSHDRESKGHVIKYRVIHTLLKRYKTWTKALIGIIEQTRSLKKSRRFKIQWVIKIPNNWFDNSHSFSSKVLKSLQMRIKTMNQILWISWWIKRLRKWIVFRGIFKAMGTTTKRDRLRQIKKSWCCQAQTSGKGPLRFQPECQMRTNHLKIITSRAFKTTCQTFMDRVSKINSSSEMMHRLRE